MPISSNSINKIIRRRPSGCEPGGPGIRGGRPQKPTSKPLGKLGQTAKGRPTVVNSPGFPGGQRPEPKGQLSNREDFSRLLQNLGS